MSKRNVLSDRYEISDQLGAGGMAEVYLGRDRVLGRTIAVKTLLSQHAGDPQFIERFRREAQHAAALNHPNVVSVFDTGSDDGTHFIVMEYIEGSTLRDMIREEGALLPERVAEIAADVCSGLAFAHGHGIIHRDIKPANIMITSSGGVKVADFGIARAATGDSVTQTAMVLGTAQYFSPEQAQSEPVDARSDLYSLGVVMYEMLTRQVPFTGSSPVAIAYKHVKEDPILPSRLNQDVPPDLEAVVMKAMAKNPDNRYQSAQEMREDLLRVMHGRPVEATPVLADATGVISPLSDDTVVLDRTRAKPVRTPEEKRRRTGFVLLGLIIAAVVGLATWVAADLFGGPRLGKVPNVIGVELNDAQDRLEAEGFDVQIDAPIFSDEPSGTVAAQDPAPNTSLEEGETVTITPSKGEEFFEVPDVLGETESSARELIEEAGLEVGNVSSRSSSTVSAGRVLDQSPDPNTNVPGDRKVDLVISSGPTQVEVPNVVGRTEGDARFILEGDGFRVQVIEEAQSPDCQQPEGRVCRQDPEAGEFRQEGATVTIYVATAASEPECSDGIDNDGDGEIDYSPSPVQGDPDCTSPEDTSEAGEEGDD